MPSEFFSHDSAHGLCRLQWLLLVGLAFGLAPLVGCGGAGTRGEGTRSEPEVVTAEGAPALKDDGELRGVAVGSETSAVMVERAEPGAVALERAETGAVTVKGVEAGAAAAEEGVVDARVCVEKLDRLMAAPVPQRTAAEHLRIASCFGRANRPGMQVQLLSLVVRDFPQSAEATTALRQSGEVYEDLGFLDRAAQAYEAYGRRYLRQDDARALLLRAACLQYVLGNDAAAEKLARFLRMAERGRERQDDAGLEALCPDALALVTEAICRLHEHEHAEADAMAEALAERRAKRFGTTHVAPAALCATRR
jgi:hypothetical protein